MSARWRACCSVAKSCLILWDLMDCSTSLLCIPLFPGVCSNSCTLSWWCYLTIPSFAIPFSFNPSQHQYLYQLVSILQHVAKVLELQLQPTVLPMNIQSWFPLGLTGLISLQSKNIGLGSHFLLLWTTFYQVTLLWLVRLEWPCMAWLIASLSYTNPFTMIRMWSMNGDGGQGNPNTHLPKKNPQSNKQSQLEKITQGKLWTITKQHQKTLYGSKGKDGSQKNTGSLLPVSPHPSSIEKFGARKDSLRGNFTPWGKENRRTQDSQQWSFAAFAPGASQRFHQRCLHWQTCLKLPQHLLSVTGAVARVGLALRSPSPFCVLLSGMWTAQHFTTYRKGLLWTPHHQGSDLSWRGSPANALSPALLWTIICQQTG